MSTLTLITVPEAIFSVPAVSGATTSPGGGINEPVGVGVHQTGQNQSRITSDVFNTGEQIGYSVIYLNSS